MPLSSYVINVALLCMARKPDTTSVSECGKEPKFKCKLCPYRAK